MSFPLRFAFFVLLCPLATAQTPGSTPSLERADLLRDHGLTQDAKREAIWIITTPTLEASHDGARMLLARLAVDEDRLGDAVDLWKQVASGKSGPLSEEAQVLLAKFADVVTDSGRATIRNAVAAAYFSSARFWITDIPRTFTVDTSWLDSTKAGIAWLDRVIEEFPNTAAAESAYEWRVRSYLGKSGSGRYGLGGRGALGVISGLQSARDEERSKRLEEFAILMQSAEDALREMREAIPASGRLQRLRFMLVQAYWRVDDKERATPWLDQIIEAAGSRETLWRQLAELRKKNWRS